MIVIEKYKTQFIHWNLLLVIIVAKHANHIHHAKVVKPANQIVIATVTAAMMEIIN